MVRAEHGRTIVRDILRTRHADTNPAQGETEPDPHMAEDIQDVFPAEQDGQQHPRRGDDQDIQGNPDVRGNRSDSRNEHARG